MLRFLVHGWGVRVGLWGALCMPLSVPHCPPDCLPLSVCPSLLSRCQAEEKMQSEVSPHPLLMPDPVPSGGKCLAPLISLLSPHSKSASCAVSWSPRRRRWPR